MRKLSSLILGCLLLVVVPKLCHGQSSVASKLLATPPISRIIPSIKYDPTNAIRSGLNDTNMINAYNVIAARALNPVLLDSVFGLVLSRYSADSLETLYRFYRDPSMVFLDSLEYGPTGVSQDSIVNYARLSSAKRLNLIRQLDSLSNESNVVHAFVRVGSYIAQSIHIRVRFGPSVLTDDLQEKIMHDVDSSVTIEKVRAWTTALALFQWRNVDDTTLEKVIAYESQSIRDFSRSLRLQLILIALNYAFTRFES